MPYEYPYLDLGTLIIESEVEPEFDYGDPDLPPFVNFSAHPSSLSEFYSIKSLVVIMDKRYPGRFERLSHRQR